MTSTLTAPPLCDPENLLTTLPEGSPGENQPTGSWLLHQDAGAVALDAQPHLLDVSQIVAVCLRRQRLVAGDEQLVDVVQVAQARVAAGAVAAREQQVAAVAQQVALSHVRRDDRVEAVL